MTETETMTTTPCHDALEAAIEAERLADAAYYDTDAPSEGPERQASLAAAEAVAAARRALAASSEPREYDLREEGGATELVVATSLREARRLAAEWVQGGEYYDVDSTFWVTCWITCLATGESDDISVAIEAAAPDCADEGHTWESPEWLGGCSENPGVWGHGGGVVITEVCAHCGTYRHTDTWAQRRDTGEQGLTSVEYRDADEASLAWIQSARDEAMIDACPYEIEARDKRGPGEYRISVAVDANDDDACDAIVSEISDAVGLGWSVVWTGEANGEKSDLRIEWVG